MSKAWSQWYIEYLLSQDGSNSNPTTLCDEASAYADKQTKEHDKPITEDEDGYPENP